MTDHVSDIWPDMNMGYDDSYKWTNKHDMSFRHFIYTFCLFIWTLKFLIRSLIKCIKTILNIFKWQAYF